MTTRFFLLLFLSVTPLLAQKSPREWEKELADRYFSYGSFVARYTGTGPAGKEINVVLAEERESRSALVRVTLDDRPMVDALHIPPGQPGAGLFLSYLGEPKTVTGLDETVTSLLDSMQAIGKMFTNKPVPKQEWQFVTNLSFLKQSLNGGLSFQVDMKPAWLKDRLTRPARNVQVMEDAVHFPLPGGSLVAIHKESGLLANHMISRRGGNIELRLLELKPLDGLKALKELCADIEWPKDKTVSLLDTELARGIRRAGFQGLLDSAAGSPLTLEQLEKRVRDGQSDLVKYWVASQGAAMRKKLTPRKVRALRGSLYPRFDKYKRTLANPPKTLTLDSWLADQRPKIQAKLARDLVKSNFAADVRADVRSWADPIRGIDPDGAAKASLFLEIFFEAGSHAIAQVMLDAAVEAGNTE